MDDQKKYDLEYKDTDSCSLCGVPKGGYDHFILNCQTLEHVRSACAFKEVLHLLPTPVIRGIPPAMGMDVVGPFWKVAEPEASKFIWNRFR